MRYGYIGLGNLGEHLAMSLVKAGFRGHCHRPQQGARPSG